MASLPIVMRSRTVTQKLATLRDLVSRVMAVVLVLQVIIPGVLAASAPDDVVWCRSVSGAVPMPAKPGHGPEPCLVCLIMSVGNAPLPADLPVLPALAARAEDASMPSQNTAVAGHGVGPSPPIRAPPAPAGEQSGARPVCLTDGCALT